MKIAVPYENGQVCPHLGHAKEFKIYDVMDDEILSSQTIATSFGSDAAALVDFLQEQKAAALLCGFIPIPAVIALQQTSIQLLGGAEGDADARIQDFLDGMLHFDRSGFCASCASACGLNHAAGQTDSDRTSEPPECDGNISACGHWCG